ncbi:TPA: VasL domain-containing protein [Citrobacter freundii]
MTTHPERHLKTGGDPRQLADYSRLRDEMNKLTHPARPDVNWQYAEELCLSLFEHNGVELQTAAWYTLARTQRAGLYGLNEGLAILEALITRQWGNLWPQPVHARMEILSALSKRLLQTMRTLTLTYADLSQLYQAEAHLKAMGEVLQRLELKHASQLDALLTLMHNAAVRLENSDGATGSNDLRPADIIVPGEAMLRRDEPAGQVKWIYVAQPEPLPNVEVMMEYPRPANPWKPFVGGMLTMLVMASAAVWGWQRLHQYDPVQMQLSASLAPLPVTLSPEQLQKLRPQLPPQDAILKETRQQLTRLARLPPDWNIDYGNHLIQQALTLWPEQTKPLAQQWRQQLDDAALPPESLNGWHQGMMQLQRLADQLNALDGKRGKYMTGSELKSQVFAITQSFGQTPPVEEQLRQLALRTEGGAAQQTLTEAHLQQLIARYALLRDATRDPAYQH